MKKFLIVGDSHSTTFTNDGQDYGTCIKDSITSVHLGPYTSYGLWLKNEARGDYKIGAGFEAKAKAEEFPDHIVGFIFGEIDCRIHIPRHLKEYGGVEEAVKKAQEPLLKLYDTFPSRERILIGIHASQIQEGHYYCFGSKEVRIEITKEWNRQLAEYGEKNGIAMISLMDAPKVQCDLIHLHHTSVYPWIRGKLKRLFKDETETLRYA